MRGLVVPGAALVLAACAIFGPADRAAIALTAAQLEACQELGRACHLDSGAPDGNDPKCRSIYDACVTDAGLR